MLHQLADSLLHVVRNAVDHGIESPEERLAAGKPSYGTVRLHAAQLGSEVIISVADDGRGIDVDAVRAKAAASGIDTDGLTDAETLQLVFHSGVSTARAAVADLRSRRRPRRRPGQRRRGARSGRDHVRARCRHGDAPRRADHAHGAAVPPGRRRRAALRVAAPPRRRRAGRRRRDVPRRRTRRPVARRRTDSGHAARPSCSASADEGGATGPIIVVRGAAAPPRVPGRRARRPSRRRGQGVSARCCRGSTSWPGRASSPTVRCSSSSTRLASSIGPATPPGGVAARTPQAKPRRRPRARPGRRRRVDRPRAPAQHPRTRRLRGQRRVRRPGGARAPRHGVDRRGPHRRADASHGRVRADASDSGPRRRWRTCRCSSSRRSTASTIARKGSTPGPTPTS